jgi:lipid-binding SYLF domain-containing protein
MRRSLAVVALIISLAAVAVASERRDNDIDRLQTSSVVLKQIMSAPDSAIPDSIMSGAKCIAILPSDLKGGFIFTANYGKGVATCRTAKGWSAPAFFRMTGGSFGFQIGGQASDLVLVIMTDDGMQHLLRSKFKLGADASAAAGPVGRDAQAATDLTMRAQILTYSRARGLFAGVSLGGGVVKQDDADTTAFYGKDYEYRGILNGQVPAPKDADTFLATVEKYAPTPRPHVAPTAASAPATAAPVHPAEAAAPATARADETTTTDSPAAAEQESHDVKETPAPVGQPVTQNAPATSSDETRSGGGTAPAGGAR